MTTTITNYSELFTHVFDTMEILDNEELPEFWYEDAEMEMLESEYWQNRILEAYAYDNDLTTEAEKEKAYERDDYAEYEHTYILEWLLDSYVIYKVSGKDLDKLPEYIPVYWVEDLESYVFLQGWYGMAAYLLKVDPFTWEEKA